jgi:outer membrane biosynthesis protein TonB
LFDSVGKNLDEDAGKRTAASIGLTLVMLTVVGSAVFVYGLYKAVEVIAPELIEDLEMIELALDDEALDEEAPPPPPPPPPPAADAADEEEEEDEEEDETPQPDEMQEEVADLDKQIDDKLKDADKPKGAVGGVIGGVEGGVVGGKIGGVIGGDLNGRLGGAKVFHHSEVKPKVRTMPAYPAAAKTMNLGDVSCKVRIFIDEAGKPYDVVFEACPKVFHGSANDAIFKWRWYPARDENNAKVRAQFLLNIKYTLR